MKKCTKCQKVKALEKFYADKRRKDGKQSQCSECQTKSNSVRYHKNKKVRERKKAYDKIYVSKNRENKNKNNKRWRDNNKDKYKKMSQEWKRRNRHKVVSYTVKRQNALKKRTPPWLSEDQVKEIEEYYWLSQDLKLVTGEKYHVDHIVPLQGEDVCGLHVPWNLQVLPSDINEKKGNKWDQEKSTDLALT